MIHPTAIIEAGAQLGAECEVQAYAVVTRHAVLGDRVIVGSFAVIGGDPQHLTFDRRMATQAIIGAGTVLREHVTVNRSIYADGRTVVGENCYLMTAAHVAHDCVIGNHVVVANNVMLAGHTSVGAHTFVGGGVAVHQFTRIGEGAMISGVARVARDAAPFTMVAERDEVIGLNLVGLRRRGVPRASVAELKTAFREVYFTAGNIRETAARALEQGTYQTPEARRFLEFFTSGKRGFARARREGGEEEAQE
ncbi:acyl-ACP--UDP-N-acetylglucosamine O-acyltransferase [Horticoccus luteus]|uniref:Acyl-ACP--UDP-N-acetylglucosamine O-acyltransferase n=1 Tax=Horticoccus luteus TaxID=2862869 RepID=A0A8F9TY99_9BACT|nr:acyl-ACP--UDP-N-acetylglucosamine O-acyltransferase [Horticoccus luteus]QYM80074.1 acyl-ACP--UDP-N-acetylglucosamine O-acyltransferase [Horticoccus luteus]